MDRSVQNFSYIISVFKVIPFFFRQACAIKLCDFNGIHVVRDKGGWDVYHAQIMSAYFQNQQATSALALQDSLTDIKEYFFF